MPEEREKLRLQFDPRTIEHLGIKMYSQLPYALAELVANAYDAGADNVDIRLYDVDPGNKSIVVTDDGDGMSYDEVGTHFLVIGRKRRDSDASRENSKGRRITGKKGVGKLALFGIGKTIRIETSKEGETEKTAFTLDWDGILSENNGTYYPATVSIPKDNPGDKGTKIVLTNLSRVTGFDLQTTAFALSKLFNWLDSSISVKISLNDGEPILLSRELKYQGLDREFEWDILELAKSIESDYEHKDELRGKIISTKKPIKQDLRGITLFVNGRLANVPSYFGVSEAGHTFSYLSGWIDADYLDEFDSDLISTDRQSISWDLPEAEELQAFLQKIVRFLVNDWSAKRKHSKEQISSQRSGINIREWYEKVPTDIRPKLSTVISQISDKPELDDEDFSGVVRQVYDLIPPYTYYHYRLLHGEVQSASRRYYEDKNYYAAFQEAMKRYKNAVKAKSGVTASEDLDIVSKAFGRGKVLETTAHFQKRPDGQPFSSQTLENVEEGQMSLSRGVVQGGRDVVSHEEHVDLMVSGLFTEKDCLDLLGLLSHLFKRLDESEKRTDTQ